MPLCERVEHLCFKQFGRERPDVVHSIEEKVRLADAKKARRDEEKLKAYQTRKADANRERGADE